MESQKSQKIQTIPVQTEGKPHQKRHNNKGQKKEKKQFKSQYVFDADAITIDSQIPTLPKKNQLLKKPQIQQFREKQKKLRQRVQKLIDQKKQLRTENYKPQKNKKGGQQNKHGLFRNQIDQVKDLREKLNAVKKERNQKRDKFNALIQEAKKINLTLKELGGQSKGSKESILQKLETLEHRFSTASLSKDEEKNLNNEIMLLKRKIKDAESVDNIQYKINSAQDRKQELNHEIEQLKEQKQPLQNQYNEIKEKLDKKNSSIDGMKKDLDSDKKQFLEQKEKNSKEWEQWKQTKKKKLDETQEKIKKLNEQNDKLWVEFNEKKEAYWKQKHYVDWIEWQMKVKSGKLNHLQRQKKRQMYDQKQKQLDMQDKLQKYIGQIELCNLLVQYLRNIKDDFNRANQANQNAIKEAVDVGAKLAADSDWKNQKVELVKSKKSQAEEEGPKKGRKIKNKNQDRKQEQKVFSIPYTVQNQFQSLKVLAPSSIDEVDKKIEELIERQRLFQRGCQEEQVSEEDTKLLENIKAKKSSTKRQVGQKKAEADEFPTI